jgi:hypothetical protein
MHEPNFAFRREADEIGHAVERLLFTWKRASRDGNWVGLRKPTRDDGSAPASSRPMPGPVMSESDPLRKLMDQETYFNQRQFQTYYCALKSLLFCSD